YVVEQQDGHNVQTRPVERLLFGILTLDEIFKPLDVDRNPDHHQHHGKDEIVHDERINPPCVFVFCVAEEERLGTQPECLDGNAQKHGDFGHRTVDAIVGNPLLTRDQLGDHELVEVLVDNKGNIGNEYGKAVGKHLA